MLHVMTARSSLFDRSFDLCEFRDDPEPLRDQIRSRRMKILLRKSHGNVYKISNILLTTLDNGVVGELQLLLWYKENYNHR